MKRNTLHDHTLRHALCIDCHSNRTVWPWYSQVAPVSWLVVSDVNRGRRRVNFSEWGSYSADKRGKLLVAICKEVTEGDMPPITYTPMHSSATLTQADHKKSAAGQLRHDRRLLQSGSEAMNVIRRVRLTIFHGTFFILLIGAALSFGHGQVPYTSSAPPRVVAQPQAEQTAASKRANSVVAPIVNLDVLVTDEDGLVLGGLKKENFRVLDDGKPQTISQFEPIGAPITIVMLMEYSGIAYDYFAYKAASWGSSFLNYLEPEDYIAVVTYDIKPTVKIDFTRNKAEVQQTLNSLSYPQFHEANVYDAIIDTLDRLDHVKGKRAILLISTGADTMGQSTLDDTLKRIKESDVTLFSVGVAEAEYQRAQISSGSSLSYLHSKNILDSFARMTGGTAWFPRFEGEIPDIFRSVATFLRSQYRLGFSPSSAAQDGKYHKLKVEVIAPDGKPLIVTNPKGKRQKPRVYAREGYIALKGEPRD